MGERENSEGAKLFQRYDDVFNYAGTESLNPVLLLLLPIGHSDTSINKVHY